MAAIALTVKSKSVTVSLTEQNVHLTPVFTSVRESGKGLHCREPDQNLRQRLQDKRALQSLPHQKQQC